MNSKFFRSRLFFIPFCLLISICIHIKLFKPIFIANSVIITYGITPFDICKVNPKLWYIIKFLYIIFLIISRVVILNVIYKYVFSDSLLSYGKKLKKVSINNSSLNLFVGTDVNNKAEVYLKESGLYQNVLVTGTIGGGKTTRDNVSFYKTTCFF